MSSPSLTGTPAVASAAPAASMSVDGTWGTGQTRTAGHLLVAIVTICGTTTAQFGKTPAGWRLDRAATSGGLNITAVFTKTAVGGDAAPTFKAVTTGTASAASLDCILLDVAPDDQGTTPLVCAAGAAGGTSGTITPATVQKVPTADCLTVAAAVCSQGTTAATTTWTAPGGWNTTVSETASATTQSAVFDVGTATAGATISGTITHGRTSTYQAAVILSFCSAAKTSPTTYYVSPSGSDSNDGKSSGAGGAWQTVSKVNGYTGFLPGDSILFQAAQTWSGTALTVPAEGTNDLPVKFGSYGAGALPVIGVTNAHAVYGLNKGGLKFENLRATSTAPSGSLHGCFWIELNDSQGHPGVTFTGCTGGGSNGTGAQDGFRVYGNNVLDLWGPVVFDNCIASWNTYEGICVLTWQSNGTFNFTYVSVTNCTAMWNEGQTGGDTTASGNGIYVRCAWNTYIGSNTVHDNGANNPNATFGVCGIIVALVDGMTIEKNVVYNQGGGLCDGDGIDLDQYCVNVLVQYNIIYNCIATGIFLFCSSAGLWGNVTVRWNMVWGNCTGSWGHFGDITLMGTVDYPVDIYNNTVIGVLGGSTQRGPFMVDDACVLNALVTVRNNVFYSVYGLVIYVHTAFTTSQIIFQGNCYYSTTTIGYSWAGTVYASLAAWRTAVAGQEQVSGVNKGMQADPQIANPSASPSVTSPANLSGAHGMDPTSNSPLLGGGLDLDALFGTSYGTADFYGSTLSEPLPIGASSTAGAAGSAVHIRDTVTTKTTGGPGFTITLDAAAPAGRLLVVGTEAYIGSNTALALSSISDSAGSSWVYSTASNNQNPPASGVYWSPNYYGFTAIGWCIAKGSVTTVTVTMNNTLSGGVAGALFGVSEYSLPNPSEVRADAGASSNSLGSGTSQATPNVTVTGADDLEYAQTAEDYGWNAADGGFTMAGWDRAWKLAPSTGSQHVTFSGTSQEYLASSILALLIGIVTPAKGGGMARGLGTGKVTLPGESTGWLYATAAAAVTGVWLDTDLATGDTTGTYSTWVSTGPGASAVLETSVFGAQAAVPEGSTITSLSIKVRHGETSPSSFASATAQAYVGSTPKGDPQALTLSADVHEDTVTVTGLSWADLADLKVRLTFTRTG